MSDPAGDSRLVFGAGLIGENLHLLSPAQRRNYELEVEQTRKDFENHRFAQEQAQRERAWLAQQRGEMGHSVEEGAQAAFAAQDRADRRAQAGEHSADCGCDRCGTRLYGAGLTEHPDAAKAEKARKEREQRAAKNREQLAMMPASNAQLAGVAGKVAKLESALNVANLKRKLFGH